MDEVDTGDVRELRPRLSLYRTWLRRNVIATVGLAVVLLAINVRSVDSAADVWILVAIVVIVPPLGFGGAVLHIRTARVRLTEGSVEYSRWWWRRVVLQVDRRLEGLLAVYAPIIGAPAPLLLLRSRDGGPRIRLSGAFWEHDDLELLAAHAGVEVTAETLSATEWQRRAPGTMPWRERHPWVIGSVGAILLVTLIVAALWVYAVVLRLPPYDT